MPAAKKSARTPAKKTARKKATKKKKSPPKEAKAMLVLPEVEVTTPVGPLIPMDVLGKVVDSFINGGTLENLEPEIQQLVDRQEDRARLISALMQTNDYRRLVKLAKVRDKLEDRMLEVAGSDDLSAEETLAFTVHVGTETEKLQSSIQVQGSDLKDLVNMLQTMDSTLQNKHKLLEVRLKNTSPQAREIIRRVAYGLGKAAGKAMKAT